MRSTQDRKFIKKGCNAQEKQGRVEREWGFVRFKGRYNEGGHESGAACRGCDLG